MKAKSSKKEQTRRESVKKTSVAKKEAIRRIVEKVNSQRGSPAKVANGAAQVARTVNGSAAKALMQAKESAAKTPVKIIDLTVAKAELVVFKIGDKIVYPGHGVGEIESIRSTSIGGTEQQFYNITILESGMKVMVPMGQASAVGLRKIIDKKTIDKVYAILKERDFKIDTQTWNRRFREYSQKIKTGSVYEIAVVLRDLSVLSADKELSFGEKKMLDMAQSLLASEIAIAKSRPQDKIVGELRALFG